MADPNIRFYNSLEKKVMPFIPIEPKKVKMYVCGPTVYGAAHIGHARTYIAFDIIKRYLKYRGFDVRHIVNITDIHDDIIKKANEQNTTIFELADRNIKLFFSDMDKLGIERADFYPRVTEHINEIIDIVKTLLDKGYAYETEDGVYFKVSKFKEYGKLSGIKLNKTITGTRVNTDKYEKEEAVDFALWKKAKPNEPSWPSPFGDGRPGWHIECSVMSSKHLGVPIDIHGGAKDLIFPHHENEIAQSEAAFGKKFVNYWIHTGLLTIEKAKMSKSLGNFIDIPTLLSKCDPKVFRFFIATKHYASEVDFSNEEISKSSSSLERINNTIQNLYEIDVEGEVSQEVIDLVKKTRNNFVSFMDNDFNTPKAIADLFVFIKKVNFLATENKLNVGDSNYILNFLKEIDSVFKVFDFERKNLKVSDEVKKLVEERELARKSKDFVRADYLRNLLIEKGYYVDDTPQGPRLRKIAK